MNIELLTKKMEKFFEEVTTEELIEEFEKMGYVFVDIKK